MGTYPGPDEEDEEKRLGAASPLSSGPECWGMGTNPGPDEERRGESVWGSLSPHDLSWDAGVRGRIPGQAKLLGRCGGRFSFHQRRTDHHRQGKAKGTAFAHRRFNPDLTAHAFDHPPRNRQPNAGMAGLIKAV